MMNDTSVTLSTIKLVQLGFNSGEYRYIRCLLLLIPKIRILHINEQLLLNIKDQLLSDHQLRQSRCNKVKQLTMFRHDQNDVINNVNIDKIKVIFPNAIIIKEEKSRNT
ncbi:unnamed protein product [Didymodactylos carnosus]|uniref:Uncharacterized protein n=1 Tax=Didymodactylos carnosus TaxID=1234261 RepID=A0A816CI71_9BILA|nr:unnamed protein product [Didymodactylos carnosus]CAF4515897.1 unnamed protein product [Didymodactylos carnosus]